MLELKQELLIRRARFHFQSFVHHMFTSYKWSWHNRLIANELQQVATGDTERLMLCLPPRHGKSELASRLFPAFIFGLNPALNIIAASYNASLAKEMNLDVQNYMLSEKYGLCFSWSQLQPTRSLATGSPNDRRNTETFTIPNYNGKYVCAGVCGSITGKGADLLIIDDPVKNHQEAESPTYRERTWNWYSKDAYSRLEDGAKVVMIMTRWHEDDLAGRVLKHAEENPETPQWRVVNLPAILDQEPYEGDPRESGEALFPDKYPLEVLESIKATLGSRYWNNLYQQRPSAEEGGIFKRSWFLRYKETSVTTGVVNFYIDPAYTKDPKNDTSAILAWFTVGDDIYIRHCQSVRLEFPELCEFIKEYVRNNGYTRSSRVYVEPKASGLSVVQQLKSTTGLNIIKDVAPTESKVSRAHGVTPVVETGRVYLQRDALWVKDFLDEVCAFPTAAHDDKVDCLTGAIRLADKKPAISFIQPKQR